MQKGSPSFFHINCKTMHTSNRIFLDFVSHRALMSGEFNSRNDSHSTKLEGRPQTYVKLSFIELCVVQSYLHEVSGLHPFDNMAIIH